MSCDELLIARTSSLSTQRLAPCSRVRRGARLCAGGRGSATTVPCIARWCAHTQAALQHEKRASDAHAACHTATPSLPPLLLCAGCCRRVRFCAGAARASHAWRWRRTRRRAAAHEACPRRCRRHRRTELCDDAPPLSLGAGAARGRALRGRTRPGVVCGGGAERSTAQHMHAAPPAPDEAGAEGAAGAEMTLPCCPCPAAPCSARCETRTGLGRALARAARRLARG
jgi:hypothetical protein